MRIKVYPGPFCNTEVLDEDGFLYLDEDAILCDVIKKLKYPILLRGLQLCTVNYEKTKMNTKLKDGDIVSFFTPLAGG